MLMPLVVLLGSSAGQTGSHSAGSGPRALRSQSQPRRAPQRLPAFGWLYTAKTGATFVTT